MYGKIKNDLQKDLEAIKSSGLYKNERVITSKQGAEISTTTQKEVLNFCANNYLGLSSNEAIIEAAVETLKTHGFGLSSVRFICGTQDIHKELEQKTAEFLGMEDCILYAAAFDANCGLFEPLLSVEDAVISDALNMKSVSKLYPVKGELEWVAFDAGNDVLCFAEHTKEGIETILKNATPEQIEESFKRVWELKEKAFNTVIAPTENYYTSKTLNTLLANQSLTVVKGNNNTIANFKTDGFIGLEITKGEENAFFNSIKRNHNFTSYSTKNSTLSNIKNVIKTEENVLIALYPPSIKPKNNFGLSSDELQLLKEIINSKNVVLYVFGNPYVLTNLDITNAKYVIVAYQDFPVFQENAADHFLDKTDAKGKLSVSIN